METRRPRKIAHRGAHLRYVGAAILLLATLSACAKGTGGTKTSSTQDSVGSGGSGSGGNSTTPQVSVTSVSPNVGSTAGGTSLTITGQNFQTGALVLLSGTPCLGATVNSSTQITCTTAPSSAGTRDILISNPNKSSAILTQAFTYKNPPVITSVSPIGGPLAGGQSVTITGSNFDPGSPSVQFGGSNCTSINRVSSTQITCVTPAHSAGTVTVKVTNMPDNISGSLTNAYTYNPAPTVTAIALTGGALAGGASVTITGTGFLSGATVALGGTTCTSPNVMSSTQITCTTGAHVAGAVDVVVTNYDLQTGTLTSGYTYRPAPTVTAISPNGGNIAGSTDVTITGTGFVSGATVQTGGVNCTSPNVVSSTQITCTTGSHAAGAVDVVVTNNDTQSGTLTNGYTYQVAPTVTSISPSAGALAGGTGVTITGMAFLSGATVQIGGVDCTSPNVVSSTQITCTTGAHAAGTTDVVVTNPDTQTGTLSNGYTYNPAPTVSTISPSAGPPAGGQSVTITGTGFISGAAVAIGGASCTSVNVVSSTQITCTTGAHASGTVDVIVVNTDTQSGTKVGGYLYNPPPTVISVSPTAGPVGGGTAMTIDGTGFLTGATVSIGGVNCTSPNVVSSTQITCTNGAHAAATVNVVVTNTDLQSGTLTNGYAYQAAPVITSLSPSGGPLAGGQSVTVNGSGFVNGATITIGGVSCTGVHVVSSTQITCTTGAHAAGTVTANISNADGQSGSLSNAYTYQVAPTVTAIALDGGALAGGSNVTITGTGFITGATVKIGGVTCTSPNVVSVTQITCTTGAHAAGAVDVVVTNADAQSGTLTNGYTYQDAPIVTTIASNIGPAVGSDAVTIGGSGFISGATVAIGGTTCSSPNVVSSTQITCTTGAHVAGVTDVVVTNPDTQTGTLTNGYTYRAAPTVTSISPAYGPIAGGTAVTVNGTGFYSGATVGIGGTTCSSPNVVSSTQITCTTGAHAANQVTVIVLNADSQTGSLSNGFTYYSPLAISPSPVTLVVGDTQTFSASGGISPYTYSVLSGGGSVNSSSGVYTAPGTSGSATVRVTDNIGNTSDSAVTINDALQISPLSATVAVGNNKTFSATGGYGTYSYAMVTGGGSINSSTGVYTAPAAAGTAKVEVADTSGHFSQATITINAALAVTPTTKKLGVEQTFSLTASGGVPSYTYSIFSGVGSIDSSAVFTAGAASGSSVARVTDSIGNTADTNVTVIRATILAVGGGGAHSCGFFTDGGTRCWGSNASGQLGQGNTTNLGDAANEMADNLPTVSLGTGKTVADLKLGASFSCALFTDGTVKCWGLNSSGQLGKGNTTTLGDNANEMGDNLTTISLGTGRTAVAISVNNATACALLDNGDLKCWGSNANGMLGQETAVASLGSSANQMGDNLSPISLGTGLTVSTFSVGNFHVCALFTNGKVKCWGRNTYGQLGLGDTTDRGANVGDMGDNLPFVDLGTGRSATQIIAGRYHTCAILDNQQLKCWGRNNNGQLGQGNTTNLGTSAGQMGDSLPYVNLGTTNTVLSLSATYYHNCAILTDNTTKCWGAGASGALGTGATTNVGSAAGQMGTNLPVLSVGTGRTVSSVYTGLSFTCVQLDNHSIKCFGLGTSGQLGQGNTNNLGDAAGEMGDSLPLVQF